MSPAWQVSTRWTIPAVSTAVVGSLSACVACTATVMQAAQVLLERFPQVDAVFSSDLLRAVQTAEVVAAAYKLQVEQHTGLRERHMGVLQVGVWAHGSTQQHRQEGLTNVNAKSTTAVATECLSSMVIAHEYLRHVGVGDMGVTW